ncbi:hypothetical protein CANCADRAFT_26417 [Tortispora caseinolytica NRRL Y-17796]|uniref:Bola-like protein n=1 Tax=Tortispora caseinolytica NRRL Y-17796 TaxID=767744 RepID=A0A1E4THL8_9ASCO|nr:hypothetical protein CANCADRAFT_26417 [Tortispora caseinolytica NRRL Y-17796]
MIRSRIRNIRFKRFYSLSSGEAELHKKLEKALEPKLLNVQDISGGCGSMYQIKIISEKFKGMSMVKQHRLVNEILKDDISKMHGVRLDTQSTE